MSLFNTAEYWNFKTVFSWF